MLRQRQPQHTCGKAYSLVSIINTHLWRYPCTLVRDSFAQMDATTVAQADQTIDILHQIATILDTGLDKVTLRILVSLCESGVNPEALAVVVKQLRREAAALKGLDSAQAPAKQLH